jgi:ABC-type transport system involved in multi-copper enzyme maturation permease subunit
MISAVRIELLKMRTTPAAWVTAGVIAGLTLLSGVVTILLAGEHGAAPLGSPGNVSHALAVGAATSVGMLVLGITISAGEDRHRTALSTYLAEPRRGHVLVAKLVAGTLVGAALGAAAYVFDLAVALPLYAAKGVHHLPINVTELGAGTVLATACFGMLGVALGALTRNTVASIIGALVWVGIVELAILQPSFPTVGKWLPAAASKALTNLGQGDHGVLNPVVASVVLLAWGAALSTIAGRVTVRREVR